MYGREIGIGREHGKIKLQITNVRNDKGAVTTDLAYINISRRFYKLLYFHELENLDWVIFQKNIAKLIQKEKVNSNSAILLKRLNQ